MREARDGVVSDAVSWRDYESLGGAMIRSLTGDPTLQWSGGILYRGTEPVSLKAAHQQDVPIGLISQRALLDGAALRLILSDPLIFADGAPTGEIEQFLFELLEQIRVESLAPENLMGLRFNLEHRFIQWGHSFVASGLTETSIGLLIFTVVFVSWSRMNSAPLPDEMMDLMESTRARIMPELSSHLGRLRGSARVQADFMGHALEISRWVASAVRSSAAEEATRGDRTPTRSGFQLRLQSEVQLVPGANVTLGQSSLWTAGGGRYRVFTRAYDEVAPIARLVREAQLTELRAEMDRELLDSALNVSKVARKLQHALSFPRQNGWQFAQEEGYIDGARLARLVIDPSERAVFKREQQIPVIDSAVGILIDCSGSMKIHAENLSLLVDSLCRALDFAGVKTEVLGFSTKSWNGGRPRRDWERAGMPEYPGRMNESLHLVFKSGNTSWRLGRRGIAGLRRFDLFREGIDGEAVQWACQRLLALPTRCRMLLVISDGCPMDAATLQVNDSNYLAEHLRYIVAQYETPGEIDVCALGVGLGLGYFYRQRLAIDLSDGVSQSVLEEVSDLLIRGIKGSYSQAPVKLHKPLSRLAKKWTEATV